MANSRETMSTEPALAKETFMRSVIIPLVPQNLPTPQKSVNGEFMIDYHVRRDSKGHDCVFRVYLPSLYKGWAIMAERRDTASPGREELPPEISESDNLHLPQIKVENPSEDQQDASADNPQYVPVSKPRKQTRQKGSPRDLLDLYAVNGVVLPSKLKPGQPPIKSPYRLSKLCLGAATVRNQRCPICADCYAKPGHLKGHFPHCVRRNGNPQGYYWNDTLSDERRIGAAIAELYCRRDVGGDWDIETSTSDGTSVDTPRTNSYEPSESCNYSQSSSPPSLATTPRSQHDRNDNTGASPQDRTSTDHSFEDTVIETLDDDVADRDDRDVDTLQVGQEERAETPLKAVQIPPSEPFRDPQTHTVPLRDDNIRTGEVLITPKVTEQYANEANTVGVNGHNSIHSDFDAIHTVPNTAVPRQSQERHAISNANHPLTPMIARGFDAGGSPKPSPGQFVPSLTGPISHTNRYVCPPSKPLRSLPPSTTKKRQTPSEPFWLSHSPKRQRIISSELPNLLQDKTAVRPNHQLGLQGRRFPPPLAEGSVLSMATNGPRPGEKRDQGHAGVRQSKGAGLRIDTKAADPAAPPPTARVPTPGEKLYTNYVSAHEEFSRELDNLILELAATKERAEKAELQVRDAENRVYKANSDGFAKMMATQDKYKRENADLQRAHNALTIYCHKIKRTLEEKDDTIKELTWALEQERQNSRSQYAKTIKQMTARPAVH